MQMNRYKYRSLTSDKQCVTREDNALISILHKIADAVLCMARGMECLDRNSLSNLEFLLMSRALSDRLAVFATNNRELAKLA